MRTNFAADLHAARARFAQQPHASGRAEVLAMDVMIATIGEEDVPHHDYFFTNSRPAGQPQERAPVTLMHDAVADEVVILAMVEHRHADHPRIFDGAPHELVVLDATPVVGDRHDAGLFERTDWRQLF